MENVDDSYIFCATMTLETPLKFLKMHGVVRKKRPTYSGTHGIWLAALPRQSGFDGQMASSIGYIPADGGDFCKLLIEAKTIASAKEPISLRRKRLAELADNPRWAVIVQKVGWASIVQLCEK